MNYIGYGIEDVQLVLTDGEVISLGPVEVYCDAPYTTRLPDDIEVELDKIRIIAYRYFNIDAVLIESKPHHKDCLTCAQSSYSIERTPSFLTSSKIVLRPNYFVDR